MAARIIVIDNDLAIREFLTEILSDEGWEVLSFAYAQVSLASLEQLHADLIILDFNTAERQISWEFLQLLKMDDATASIPILVVTTAFQLSLELQEYLRARYIHVVTKPFDLDPFFRLIQTTLDLAGQAAVIFSSDHTLPILVVDDEEYLREALATILRLEGYPVETANNGLLALEAVYKADYSLILLDIQMPIMDGFEFLSAYDRQLRSHIPVVIISAEETLLTRVLPGFVVDRLPKPFEINALLRAVEKYAQPV